MAENRCPMCGKENAPDAVECEHCQARLSPLIIDPQDQQRELGGTIPGFDKTDNLADSRLQSLGGDDEPGMDEETARITEDWQAAFRTESQILAEDPPGTVDLGGETSNEPDWLQRIREAEKNEPAPLGDPLAKQEADQADDWLNKIRQKQEEDTLTAPTEVTPDETWLADAESVLDRQEESEEGLDWLQGITGDLSDYVFPGSETGSLNEGDLDLGDVDGPPSWMLDTVEPDSISPKPVEIPFEEAEPEPDPLADWLTQKKEEEQADAAPSEDLPDWISDMAESPSAADDQTIVNQIAEPDVEDWLAAAKPEEPAIEPDLEPADLPEWMQGLKPQVPDQIGSSEESYGETTSEEDPWETIRTQPTEDKTVELPEEGAPEETPQRKQPRPDWLSGIHTGPLPASADIKSAPAFSADLDLEEDDLQVTDIVLPDWMSELDPDAEPEEPFFPEEEEEGLELAPAELPTWLQAMRPVELMAEDELLDPVEGEEVMAGPLAGLRGVLPAEPDIIQFGKPPEYPSRLQVTEKQQQFAALMENMISTEDEVIEVEKPAFKLPQQVLRWLAAGLLFLAVFIPSFAGSTQVQMPSITPEEIQSSLDIINAGFENKAPVLAVFDYQPALSAELEASAASVIDHLMFQGAHLTLISTNPTGPGLAETFLQDNFEHSYLQDKDYVQLGYLSGGASGIQLFSNAPRMAIPLMVENQQDGSNISIWEHPDLRNIASINDFSMVLLITDDPDLARTWIEQSSQCLLDTPLIMVVSAQAEPFVYPYYQVTPRQVDGIIAGLEGAAYYETNTAGNTARRYWDAYTYAVIISLVMILAGTGYYTITNMLEKRKATARGTQA